MNTKFYDLLKDTESSLCYPVEYIKFVSGNRSFFMKYFRPKNVNTLGKESNRVSEHVMKEFIIKPELSADTYCLYENDTFHSFACVQDYKTSVWLNNLFRIIKENKNLDLLEESDDEEEFEEEDNNKYLNGVTSKKVICEYNQKFKKWVPIKEIT